MRTTQTTIFHDTTFRAWVGAHSFGCPLARHPFLLHSPVNIYVHFRAATGPLIDEHILTFPLVHNQPYGRAPFEISFCTAQSMVISEILLLTEGRMKEFGDGKTNELFVDENSYC